MAHPNRGGRCLLAGAFAGLAMFVAGCASTAEISTDSNLPSLHDAADSQREALGGTSTAVAVTPPTAAAVTSAPDAAAGRHLFVKNCSACHGVEGQGGSGSKLQGIHELRSPEQIVNWIKNPSANMPKLYPAPLDEQAVRDLSAYLKDM